MLIRRNNQNEGAGWGVMMRLTVTMEGEDDAINSNNGGGR